MARWALRHNRCVSDWTGAKESSSKHTNKMKTHSFMMRTALVCVVVSLRKDFLIRLEVSVVDVPGIHHIMHTKICDQAMQPEYVTTALAAN